MRLGGPLARERIARSGKWGLGKAQEGQQGDAKVDDAHLALGTVLSERSAPHLYACDLLPRLFKGLRSRGALGVKLTQP